MGAAVAALEQLGGVLFAQAGARIDHFHCIAQHAHTHLAVLGVFDGVADQVAERDRQGGFRGIDDQIALAFQHEFQGFSAELGAVRVDQLFGHLGDIAAALPALVAREQQQRADQIAALLLGALDALQPLQHLFVQVGLGQQQLGGAADHRQRGAQFVADVGVEFAVALHHFGQTRRVVVQRFGQLADLVVREVRGQWLGLAGAAAIGPQACGQIGDRPHHLGRGPPADQQRKPAEHQYRQDQGALELDFALQRLGHVVGEEEPFARRFAHRKLVRIGSAAFVDAGDGVDAVGQLVPLRLFAA